MTKEEVVDYIILKPICQGCEKEIDTPADTDMEVFRYGVIAHSTCLQIYHNLRRRYGGYTPEHGDE
jgi:hypothetical protein